MRILKVAGFLVLMIFCGTALSQYFFSPQFAFTQSQPFSGSKLYNPYQDINPSKWIKCNFHAHTTAWNGFTNGHGCPANAHKAYNALNYAVRCISQYQYIDTAYSREAGYIPTYEHGFNIGKTHQLVVGATHVEWFDYLYPQTLSNKQYILNKLSQDGKSVVFLNHPALRSSYKVSDMACLSNYTCLEVLHPQYLSFEYWDAALSAGKVVFIAGDDDTHDMLNFGSIGRYCTMLNVPTVNRENILSALRKGRGYGLVTGHVPGEFPVERIQRLRHNLPALEDLVLHGDTLTLKVTGKAKEICFVGQDGKTMEAVTDTAAASYIIGKNDTYIRTNILFENGTALYLNPVFRYQQYAFSEVGGYRINTGKTCILLITGVLMCVLLLLWAMRFLFGWQWSDLAVLRWRPQYPHATYTTD